MSEDAKLAAMEAALPIVHRGPWPRTAPGLKNLPTEMLPYYGARNIEGGVSLTWLNADDAANVSAHQDAIANGSVRLVPPGRTIADVIESDRQQEENSKAFARELATGEARQAAEREQRRQVAEAKAVADARARYARR